MSIEEPDLSSEAQFAMVLALLYRVVTAWRASWRNKKQHYRAAMAGWFFCHTMVTVYQHRPGQEEHQRFNALIEEAHRLTGSQPWGWVDSGDPIIGTGPVAAAVKDMLNMSAAAKVLANWAEQQRDNRTTLMMCLTSWDWLTSADDTAGASIDWPRRREQIRDAERLVAQLGGRVPPR